MCDQSWKFVLRVAHHVRRLGLDISRVEIQTWHASSDDSRCTAYHPSAIVIVSDVTRPGFMTELSRRC